MPWRGLWWLYRRENSQNVQKMPNWLFSRQMSHFWNILEQKTPPKMTKKWLFYHQNCYIFAKLAILGIFWAFWLFSRAYRAKTPSKMTKKSFISIPNLQNCPNVPNVAIFQPKIQNFKKMQNFYIFKLFFAKISKFLATFQVFQKMAKNLQKNQPDCQNFHEK